MKTTSSVSIMTTTPTVINTNVNVIRISSCPRLKHALKVKKYNICDIYFTYLFLSAKKIEEDSPKYQILPYILLMIPVSILICLLLLCVRLSYVLISVKNKENEYDEVQELPQMPEMQDNSRGTLFEPKKVNILETSLQLSTVEEGEEDEEAEELDGIVVDTTESNTEDGKGIYHISLS